MSNTDLKTASVLAFERKIDPSDGLFYGGQWDMRNQPKWEPVTIHAKSIRGTISNRLKATAQDPAKLDASIQNPNLQQVDVATLPPHADTLKVQINVRVLPGVSTPAACNERNYQEALQKVIQEYIHKYGFTELARRYAHNLANGRFLWRNRFCAEAIEIVVHRIKQGEIEKEWHFDGLAFSLRNFEFPPERKEDLTSLADTIEKGLNGEVPVFLKITSFARVGVEQEVFPSQELILDQRGNQKGGKSKTLYQVQGTAALHSQKIGNAIRTIDTWYPDAHKLNFGPIAVEPYGSVTTRGIACRQPASKMDFYTLLDRWVLKDDEPPPEQQHFVISTLIRGGVFGESQD